MQERPTKPLHHKLHTAMNTPPTETNWLNLVKNLNTPGIPPSIRNQALQVATNMKPLNNRMAHLCDVAPTCHYGCDSPETMKHILNRCGHNSAAKTLVGLNNFHTSTLPQELARVEVRSALGLSTQAVIQKAAIVHPRYQQYDPP
ncbi:hypothetical protein Pelo_19626 [Pelomyxa schiedti]|nr:hypothetical protein Pelo_19626 [Pelomyxa schiedti]